MDTRAKRKAQLEKAPRLEASAGLATAAWRFPPRLESQSGILMPALRANAKLDPAGRGINRITPHAMKRRSPPLQLISLVVPVVVKKPQDQENRRHQGAEDHSGRRNVEHPLQPISGGTDTATKKRAGQTARRVAIVRVASPAAGQAWASPAGLGASAAGAASAEAAGAGAFLALPDLRPLDFL